LQDRERATELFSQGNEAFRAGRIADARNRYLLAWRLMPSFDIACNLGRAEAELELWRQAASHLRYCLDHFAATSRPEYRKAESKFRELYGVVRQRETLSLARQGHCDEAERALSDWAGLQPSPDVLSAIAECDAGRGRLVEALARYDRVLELIDRGAAEPDQIAGRANAARERIRRRTPSITVALESSTPIERAELDGKRTSALALRNRVFLNPGRHRLLIVSPGRAPYRMTFELAEGQHRVLTPEVAAPVEAPRPTGVSSTGPGPPADSAATSRTAVLAGEAALSLVGLAVGTGYALARATALDRARSTRSEIAAATPSKGACVEPGAELASSCDELHKARSDVGRYADLANLGFAAAGVGAAGALLTFWLWRPQDGPSRANPASTATWSLRFRGVF
jgi:tetratricopeptide (TPR) repeat protein